MASPPNNLIFHQIKEETWSRLDALFKSPPDSLDNLVKLISDTMKATGNCLASGEHNSLRRFFHTNFKDEAIQTRLLTVTIPNLTRLALMLPTLIPKEGIQCLEKGKPGSVTLSRLACASILSHAFFSTFFEGSSTERGTRPTYHYPPINFSTLYGSLMAPQEEAKLLSIMNYFDMIAENEPTGFIRFQRKVLLPQNTPKFAQSEKPLSEWIIEPTKSIEECEGMLQVDFANAFLGGGVLCGGCVQEEIRFAVAPELIVGCLFSEKMLRHEAIIILGSQQYSTYRGYGFSLRYGGSFVDKTPVVDGFIRTEICAIDACDYRQLGSEFQYRQEVANREILKAYVGFSVESETQKNTPVATGKWGCGAFLGDKFHKTILQYIAASEAGRQFVFCTFGDREFSEGMSKVAEAVKESGLNVGGLLALVLKYSDPIQQGNMFDFLHQNLPKPTPTHSL